MVYCYMMVQTLIQQGHPIELNVHFGQIEVVLQIPDLCSLSLGTFTVMRSSIHSNDDPINELSIRIKCIFVETSHGNSPKWPRLILVSLSYFTYKELLYWIKKLVCCNLSTCIWLYIVDLQALLIVILSFVVAVALVCPVSYFKKKWLYWITTNLTNGYHVVKITNPILVNQIC